MVVIPERDETNLRVFNTAKKFAEEILFPMMDNYQKNKRQSDFGSPNIEEAKFLNEEIKDIERYNGLKGMCDTVGCLIIAISSTVRLKGNKIENKKLIELTENIERIKKLFHERRDNFFIMRYKNLETKETLNREFFEKVKKMVDACYINTEILMTRNKLLFADAKDDYMNDEEIKKSIRQEYIEG